MWRPALLHVIVFAIECSAAAASAAAATQHRGAPPTCATVQDELLMGGDLLPDSLKFATHDAMGCCTACRNHTGCDAWSWGDSSSRLPLRCYLKELSRTTTSEKKAKGFVTGSSTGKPLPPRPTPPPAPPVAPLPFDTEVTVDATAAAPASRA